MKEIRFAISSALLFTAMLAFGQNAGHSYKTICNNGCMEIYVKCDFNWQNMEHTQIQTVANVKVKNNCPKKIKVWWHLYYDGCDSRNSISTGNPIDGYGQLQFDMSWEWKKSGIDPSWLGYDNVKWEYAEAYVGGGNNNSKSNNTSVTPPDDSYNKKIATLYNHSAADYVRYSEIHYKKKEYQKCINMCMAAIQKNPNEAMAYNNMGAAYNCLGQYDLAISSLEKAIDIDPSLEIAKNNLKWAENKKRETKPSSSETFKKLFDDPNLFKAK